MALVRVNRHQQSFGPAHGTGPATTSAVAITANTGLLVKVSAITGSDAGFEGTQLTFSDSGSQPWATEVATATSPTWSYGEAWFSTPNHPGGSITFSAEAGANDLDFVRIEIYEYSGHSKNNIVGAVISGDGPADGVFTLTLPTPPDGTSEVLSSVTIVLNSGTNTVTPGGDQIELFDVSNAAAFFSTQTQARSNSQSKAITWLDVESGDVSGSVGTAIEVRDASADIPKGKSNALQDDGAGYFPVLLDVRNWISPRGGLVVQKWFTEELEPPAAGAASDIAAIGSLSITGVADLDALGSLLAAGTLSITGVADLDARGTLIAAGALSITGAADLDASGSLLAAGSLSISGAADLDAIGQLIAAGSIVINGSADLTSAATEDIAATGSLSISGVADLDATGSLLAAGLLQINGLASLTSGDENDLSAVGLLQITGSATLTSFGALIAAGSIVITGSADLTDGGVAPAPPPSFGGGGMGPLSPSISYRIDQRVKPKKAKERKREREKQVELEKPQPEVSTVVEAKPTFTIGDQIDAAQLERLRELAAELQRTRGLVVEIAGKVSDSEFDQALALLLLMSMD